MYGICDAGVKSGRCVGGAVMSDHTQRQTDSEALLFTALQATIQDVGATVVEAAVSFLVTAAWQPVSY